VDFQNINKMGGTTADRNRVTVFDGKAESYDKWEIQWNAFVEVEGILCLRQYSGYQHAYI